MTEISLDEILRAVYDSTNNALKVSPSGNWIPGADDTYDLGSSLLQWKDIYINGIAYLDTTYFEVVARVNDDILFNLGTTSDGAILNRSTTLNANTALTGVIIGTPVTPALAANSLIIANITADGDVLIVGNDGGHSRVALFFDASAPDTILYNVGGTWSAGATAWTIPAHTLGGAVTGNSQNISGLGTIASVSLATSAATPLLLTNGQLVNIALTSQTVGATTLTIPDFASVVDEFTFKTKAQTMANKTLTAPTINGTIATTGLTLPALILGGTVSAATATFALSDGRIRFPTLVSDHFWMGIGGTADTNAMLGWEVVSTLFTMVNKAPAATVGNTLYDSAFELRGEYWDGAASQFYMVRHLWDLTATTPAGTYSIEVPYLTPRFQITSAGVITFPNATIGGATFTGTLNLNGSDEIYVNSIQGNSGLYLYAATDYREGAHLFVATSNAAHTAFLNRLQINGDQDITPITWTNSTHTGLNITSGSSLQYNGVQVVSAQGLAVADATDAASVILRLNELLARTRAHGLIAT